MPKRKAEAMSSKSADKKKISASKRVETSKDKTIAPLKRAEVSRAEASTSMAAEKGRRVSEPEGRRRGWKPSKAERLRKELATDLNHDVGNTARKVRARELLGTEVAVEAASTANAKAPRMKKTSATDTNDGGACPKLSEQGVEKRGNKKVAKQARDSAGVALVASTRTRASRSTQSRREESDMNMGKSRPSKSHETNASDTTPPRSGHGGDSQLTHASPSKARLMRELETNLNMNPGLALVSETTTPPQPRRNAPQQSKSLPKRRRKLDLSGEPPLEDDEDGLDGARPKRSCRPTSFEEGLESLRDLFGHKVPAELLKEAKGNIDVAAALFLDKQADCESSSSEAGDPPAKRPRCATTATTAMDDASSSHSTIKLRDVLPAEVCVVCWQDDGVAPLFCSVCGLGFHALCLDASEAGCDAELFVCAQCESSPEEFEVCDGTGLLAPGSPTSPVSPRGVTPTTITAKYHIRLSEACKARNGGIAVDFDEHEPLMVVMSSDDEAERVEQASARPQCKSQAKSIDVQVPGVQLLDDADDCYGSEQLFYMPETYITFGRRVTRCTPRASETQSIVTPICLVDGCQIAIRSHFGSYVSVEAHGVLAARTTLTAASVFTVSGEAPKFSLTAHDGSYLSGSEGQLVVTKRRRGQREHFAMEPVSAQGDVSIQSSDGAYLRAEAVGRLAFCSQSVGHSELFFVTAVTRRGAHSRSRRARSSRKTPSVNRTTTSPASRRSRGPPTPVPSGTPSGQARGARGDVDTPTKDRARGRPASRPKSLSPMETDQGTASLDQASPRGASPVKLAPSEGATAAATQGLPEGATAAATQGLPAPAAVATTSRQRHVPDSRHAAPPEEPKDETSPPVASTVMDGRSTSATPPPASGDRTGLPARSTPATPLTTSGDRDGLPVPVTAATSDEGKQAEDQAASRPSGSPVGQETTRSGQAVSGVASPVCFVSTTAVADTACVLPAEEAVQGVVAQAPSNSTAQPPREPSTPAPTVTPTPTRSVAEGTEPAACQDPPVIDLTGDDSPPPSPVNPATRAAPAPSAVFVPDSPARDTSDNGEGCALPARRPSSSAPQSVSTSNPNPATVSTTTSHNPHPTTALLPACARASSGTSEGCHTTQPSSLPQHAQHQSHCPQQPSAHQHHLSQQGQHPQHNPSQRQHQQRAPHHPPSHQQPHDPHHQPSQQQQQHLPGPQPQHQQRAHHQPSQQQQQQQPHAHPRPQHPLQRSQPQHDDQPRPPQTIQQEREQEYQATYQQYRQRFSSGGGGGGGGGGDTQHTTSATTRSHLPASRNFPQPNTTTIATSPYSHGPTPRALLPVDGVPPSAHVPVGHFDGLSRAVASIRQPNHEHASVEYLPSHAMIGDASIGHLGRASPSEHPSPGLPGAHASIGRLDSVPSSATAPIGPHHSSIAPRGHVSIGQLIGPDGDSFGWSTSSGAPGAHVSTVDATTPLVVPGHPSGLGRPDAGPTARVTIGKLVLPEQRRRCE